MSCCSSVIIGADSDEEAVNIIKGYFREKNFNADNVLRSFFSRLRKLRKDHFGNGREARNLFVNAKQKHALRLGANRKITDKMLTVLELDDITEASADIISSEPDNKGRMISIGF